MKTSEIQQKIFEISTIRLTAEETRLIFRVHHANGKPVEAWRGDALVDLGLMKLVALDCRGFEKAIKDGWERLRAASTRKDLSAVSAALSAIQLAKRKAEKRGLVLTDAGKEVARGLTVRLSRSK